MVDEVDRVLEIQLRLLENLLREGPSSATEEGGREREPEPQPVEAEKMTIINGKHYQAH